jgi:hypothetical protein
MSCPSRTQREVRSRFEAHGCWEPLWRVGDPASGLDPEHKALFGEPLDDGPQREPGGEALLGSGVGGKTHRLTKRGMHDTALSRFPTASSTCGPGANAQNREKALSPLARAFNSAASTLWSTQAVAQAGRSLGYVGSAIQLPWKPSGTRVGRWMRAIGGFSMLPASRMASSLLFSAGS